MSLPRSSGITSVKDSNSIERKLSLRNSIVVRDGSSHLGGLPRESPSSVQFLMVHLRFSKIEPSLSEVIGK